MPKKKDIYTIEHDFSDQFKQLDLVKIKQVVYTDNRLYQTLLLEGDYTFNAQSLMDTVKNNQGIMDMLDWVSPFSMYGFLGHKIAITFKKHLILSEKRALAITNHILRNFYTTR